MILWSAVMLALGAIRRNAGRSLLTALGVVIGVGSVIAMVNLGQAAGQQVTANIAAMGPNLLFVRPGTTRAATGGTRAEAVPFDPEDVAAIAQGVDGVVVAPGASASATRVLPLAVGPASTKSRLSGEASRSFGPMNQRPNRFSSSANETS